MELDCYVIPSSVDVSNTVNIRISVSGMTIGVTLTNSVRVIVAGGITTLIQAEILLPVSDYIPFRDSDVEEIVFICARISHDGPARREIIITNPSDIF